MVQYNFAIYFASKSLKGLGTQSVLIVKNVWLAVIMVLAFIVYYFVGYFGIRRLSKYLMQTFLVIMSALVIILGLVFANAVNDDRFYSTRIWLCGFVTIQIILTLFTIFIACVITFYDFHTGELADIFKNERNRTVARKDSIQDRFDID
jgi:amino acid transporter